METIKRLIVGARICYARFCSVVFSASSCCSSCSILFRCLSRVFFNFLRYSSSEIGCIPKDINIRSSIGTTVGVGGGVECE